MGGEVLPELQAEGIGCRRSLGLAHLLRLCPATFAVLVAAQLATCVFSSLAGGRVLEGAGKPGGNDHRQQPHQDLVPPKSMQTGSRQWLLTIFHLHALNPADSLTLQSTTRFAGWNIAPEEASSYLQAEASNFLPF